MITGQLYLKAIAARFFAELFAHEVENLVNIDCAHSKNEPPRFSFREHSLDYRRHTLLARIYSRIGQESRMTVFKFALAFGEFRKAFHQVHAFGCAPELLPGRVFGHYDGCP